MTQVNCKICGAATSEFGTKSGTFHKRDFHFRRCGACRYTFVADPWTDFATIYGDDYYHGKGPDPSSDYYGEMANLASTNRWYEWRGVFTAVGSLISLNPHTQWLDFGCGNGGLVNHARSQGVRAVGFEEGSIAKLARDGGTPILGAGELARHEGEFDVVTAIEVLEHVTEPMATLRQIRAMLKPGGLFFYTTGNARPYRKRLMQWSYCVPEIHVGFFEPETMRIALQRAGFRPERRGYLPGFTDMIRYRILKGLRARQQSAWEHLVPWGFASRAAQWRLEMFAHPVGWAEGTPDEALDGRER